MLYSTYIEQSWSLYSNFFQQFDNSQVHPGCERAGLPLFVGGNSLHLWQKQLAPQTVPESRPASQTTSLRPGLASFPGQARHQCRTTAQSLAEAVEGKKDNHRLICQTAGKKSKSVERKKRNETWIKEGGGYATRLVKVIEIGGNWWFTKYLMGFNVTDCEKRANWRLTGDYDLAHNHSFFISTEGELQSQSKGWFVMLYYLNGFCSICNVCILFPHMLVWPLLLFCNIRGSNRESIQQYIGGI